MAEAPAGLPPLAALALLQHGDSQFPSGAFAYSAGIEGLLADGMLDAAGLEPLLQGLLETRWARGERVQLLRAWHAAADDDRLALLDREVEASLLAPAERLGSRRAGAALRLTHLRLGTPGAARLEAGLAAGKWVGHRVVTEGVLWRDLGLDGVAAALLSGYAFVNGLTTAALRLGYLTALGQQALLARLLPAIAQHAATALPADGLPRVFQPLAEVAIMRRERRAQALFAT